MSAPWDPDFTARSPIFAPLADAAMALRRARWPSCDELNDIIANRRSPVVNTAGIPLRFVAQQLRHESFEEKFEPRIFLRGEVQFRASNWHDLLNALVWLVFPAAKAALNQRHYHELEQQRGARTLNRGPAQDALTLFDEGGVIVASRDPELSALLTGSKWKKLFWRRRAEVLGAMRFYLLGHALYEKALAPFSGVTGRAVIFTVADDFFKLPLEQQIENLDARLAVRLGDTQQLLTTAELAPLPILGIPGWCPDNTQEEYYDNTAYFRPARTVTVRP